MTKVREVSDRADYADNEAYKSQLNLSTHTDESKRKTVTRTFRLDEPLNESLENLSEQSQITPSNLLNQILTQFVNWNRFVNTRDSPFITFYSRTLTSLMQSVDEEKLLKIAREVETEATIDYIKFRWGKLNLQTFIRYFQLVSAYSNQGQINFIMPNGEKDPGLEEEKILQNYASNEKYFDTSIDKGTFATYDMDGVLVIIAIQHHLGLEWSKFIGTLVSSVFKHIEEADAEFEASNNSCFVTIKKSKQ